jgi:hypothetical protein
MELILVSLLNKLISPLLKAPYILFVMRYLLLVFYKPPLQLIYLRYVINVLLIEQSDMLLL